jgi:hypothetical protein
MLDGVMTDAYEQSWDRRYAVPIAMDRVEPGVRYTVVIDDC